MPDYYQVLKVAPTATDAEIRAAYRRLVRQVHPDRGGDAERFQLVHLAWTTLSDPAKRAAYDRRLATGPGTRAGAERAGGAGAGPTAGAGAGGGWSGPAGFERSAVGDLSGSRRLIQVRPRFGRWRLVGVVAMLGWLVAVVWPVVTTSGWSFSRIALAALVPACALPRSWRDRIPPLRLLQYLALAAVLPVGIALYAGDATVRTRYTVLVGALVIVWILVAKWSAESELADAITRRLTYDINVYGRPGAALVDGSHLGRPATYNWSNDILETVVQRLPAAKLIHGARIRELVIGHLLLAGDRVALIAPATWPGGTYAIDQNGSIRRDGRPFEGLDPHLEEAVTAWRRRLKHATVRGFLVVRPEAPITLARWPVGDVTMLTGDSAAEELTAWLRPGGATLDRRLLHDILYRAPLDLR